MGSPSASTPLVGSDLKRHYDEYYSSPTEWRSIGAVGKAANIASLWRRNGCRRANRVVEIGCGDGAVAQRLVKRGFTSRVQGFDISTSAIDAAREREIPEADFSTFDGVTLPVEAGAFDLAILSHVVEHLEHPRQAIAEAARVADWVVIEVPLELTVRTPKHFRWTALGHINLYNPLLIRHLLESCGLAVLDELLTCPAREMYTFNDSPTRGSLKWALKAGLLRALPPLAPHLVSYHDTLLCRSQVAR